MRRLLSALLLMLGIVAIARACAPAYPAGARVGITAESALIVYDAKTRMEHFIRRANFDTSAAYFGFLVPTPSLPLLAEVPSGLFDVLERWTAPEVRHEERIRYTSLFSTITFTDFVAGAARNAPAAKAAVEVIDQQTVAGMDATILKASDAEKLRDWLKEHGYEARPALTEWLAWYVKNGWYLTAFQYKKDNARAQALTTRAVRISFETDQPFYPYREPTDQREGTTFKPRSLRVFVLDAGRVEGKLGTNPWVGQLAWSNPLDAHQGQQLTGLVADPLPRAEQSGSEVAIPQGAWLSVFDDHSTPRPGTDEVYFGQSDNQDSVKRPPIIRYHDVYRTSPQELAGLSVACALMVLGGGLLVWRFGARRAE